MRLDERETTKRLADALRAAGIAALITDARVTAVFPDGDHALFERLDMDTKREYGVSV